MDPLSQFFKMLKNNENLLPFVFFLVLVLGPVIKALIQKKKRQQAQPGQARQPQQEESPDWWETAEEEPAQPALPPPPPPRPVEIPRAVVSPKKPEVMIEHASDDVVEEADEVSREADAVSAMSRTEAFKPTEGGMASEPDRVEAAVRSPLDRLSPLEAALILGTALDRPVAFSAPSWERF